MAAIQDFLKQDIAATLSQDQTLWPSYGPTTRFDSVQVGSILARRRSAQQTNALGRLGRDYAS
jgi:hypothetical protein